MCGDCLDLLRDTPDKSIDLIVTDPPYLMRYKTNYRKDKGHRFCSEISGDDDPLLIKKAVRECYRVLKDDSAMYMFCNSAAVDVFKRELQAAGFNIKNMIVWMKNNWTAGDLGAAFGKQYELIFLVNKGRRLINGKRLTDIWTFDRVAGKALLHQNQKPIPLLTQCIEKHSSPGDVVLDPFMGSGSTGVACMDTGRRFIGMELDQAYFDTARERISAAYYAHEGSAAA